MARQTVARQSRKVKFSAAFITTVVRGGIAGRWTDTESSLRVKATNRGGQCYLDKKVNGKPVTFTPKDSGGRTLQNTAALWTLPRAREWAKGVVVDISRGVEPAPKAATAASPSVLFSALGSAYLERYAKTHTPSATTAETYGVKYANAVLGSMAPADIDADAADRLKDHYAGSPANARKAWAAAQRVQDTAMSDGLTKINIFRAMKGPKPPSARIRYPRLEDLAAIDQACLATKGVGSDLIRFLMRLPLRVDAAASLTWGEVDLEHREIVLQAGDGRNPEDAERLHLPSLAAELLAERKPQYTKPQDLVFASDSKQNQGGKFSGWSRLYDRLRTCSGVGGWSAHDFRRSCLSLVAEHRPEISEKALGRLLTHARSSTNTGVKKVYQQTRGFKAMQLAAQAWDELLRIALADNAAALRRVGK